MEYKGWNIDTSNIIEKDRDSKGWYSDELFCNEKTDILCLVYSIIEVTMGWSIGKLTIYKNKKNPTLWINPQNIKIMGCKDQIEFSENGRYIFIKIYLAYGNSVYLPILIIDINVNKFSIIYTHNSSPYSVVEINEEMIKLAENYRDTNFYSLNNVVIKYKEMEWINLDKIDYIKNFINLKNFKEGYYKTDSSTEKKKKSFWDEILKRI